MKRCRTCGRIYNDDELNFCLDDGALLSTSLDPQATLHLPPSRRTNQSPTEVLPVEEIPELSERPAAPLRKRNLRAWIIGAVIVLLGGVAITFITYYQVNRVNTNGNNDNPSGAVKREGVITTDVFLRSDPSPSNSPIGIAENGSRVHILGEMDNWYQVAIIEHGRKKHDPASADRGWVYKKYVIVP